MRATPTPLLPLEEKTETSLPLFSLSPCHSLPHLNLGRAAPQAVRIELWKPPVGGVLCRSPS